MESILMKMIFNVLAITFISAFATNVSAGEPVIQYGNYDVTITFDGNDMTSETCLGNNEVATLQDLIINTLGQPMMKDNCSVNLEEQSQKSAKWKMVCAGDFVKQTTTGTITWDPTSFSGAAKSKMGNIDTEYSFKSERVGDCE